MRLTDGVSDKTVTQSIAPAAQTDGTHAGTAVDLANAGNAWVIFPAGTRTDGTHTPKIQESDTTTSGDFTDVAAADQIGTLAAITSNTQQKAGYIGHKRYLRAVITTTGSTTGAVAGAYVVTGEPHKAT